MQPQVTGVADELQFDGWRLEKGQGKTVHYGELNRLIGARDANGSSPGSDPGLASNDRRFYGQSRNVLI